MAITTQESKPDKRHASKAEALRLASESRSPRAVAQHLGISELLPYR